ncbi:MAG: porin family protein [Gammaproteobacteria bacterium]|nr:porin family protein [Gammaproteobacteria bacterium]
MKTKLIASLIVLIAATNYAPAHAKGFNIGVMAGESNLIELANRACDDLGFNSQDFFAAANCLTGDDELTFGINASYYFTNHIGVEGGYLNLGDSSFVTVSPIIDLPFGFPPPLETVEISTNVVYGALAGTLPLSERLSLTGRVGLYEASIDVAIDDGFGIASFELESTSDTYFGASINYDITRNVSLQLRHDNFDVEVNTVGLAYSF